MDVSISISSIMPRGKRLHIHCLKHNAQCLSHELSVTYKEREAVYNFSQLLQERRITTTMNRTPMPIQDSNPDTSGSRQKAQNRRTPVSNFSPSYAPPSRTNSSAHVVKPSQSTPYATPKKKQSRCSTYPNAACTTINISKPPMSIISVREAQVTRERLLTYLSSCRNFM